MALCFLFLYAPILILIIFSFNASKSRAVWAGFTLNWYAQLFENSRILNALWVTLSVSLLAAVISTILGTMAAIGFHNMNKRFRNVCMTVNNIPLTNADIITGVSMMLLFMLAVNSWRSVTGSSLSLGFWSLLIAHISFDVPYVILSVQPKLRQLDPNIYEAAQDLGDHGLHAFFRVILPEIMSGVVSGFIMSFTLSVDDFVISYFTAGSRTETLSMVIYSMAKKRVSPEINALSTLLFVVVISLMILANVIQTRQEKRAQKRRTAQASTETRFSGPSA